MTSFSEEFFGCSFNRERPRWSPAVTRQRVCRSEAASSPRTLRGQHVEEERIDVDSAGALFQNVRGGDDTVACNEVSGQQLAALVQNLEELRRTLSTELPDALLASLAPRLQATLVDALGRRGAAPPLAEDAFEPVSAAPSQTSWSTSASFDTPRPQLMPIQEDTDQPLALRADAAAVAAAVLDALGPQLNELEGLCSGLATRLPADESSTAAAAAMAAEAALRPALARLEALPVTSALEAKPRFLAEAKGSRDSALSVRRVDLLGATDEALVRIDKVASGASCYTASSPSSRRFITIPSPHSGPSPRKGAFVVNFRRLLELGKVFNIIHEFIKATAIAALTLVVVGSLQQLVYSVISVSAILFLYGIHESSYDTLEISDFRQLIELVTDDEGPPHARQENPNRILKAITRSNSRTRRIRTAFVGLVMTTICCVSWGVLFRAWTSGDALDGVWLALLGDVESGDQAYRAGMLLVGSLLIGLHLSFEWLRWRETQCIMPTVPSNPSMNWDPQMHGVPPGYRWFGLPSMWFSSREAYVDLKLWIEFAIGCERREVSKIFPEEMAFLALEPGNAGRLRRALLRSKLYHARTGRFMTRAELSASAGTNSNRSEPRAVRATEAPEELAIELVMYDRMPGRYLRPEEEYTCGVMKSASALERG
eukprot:TRINITY_DN11799_c0_g1_i2.p1 TRINITY_DN11799_c0_g1~~TRINITY_DN11799_c0_g1_i2.p1  ORF type:complete len:681 (-),score=115.23 TRINITY_DN11799_c0_g1_i2:70-2040(-)